VRWIAIAALLAVALAAITVGLAAGGGERQASGCLILDVSESTDEARDRYPEEFQRFATEIAADGSGDICLILAAADPIAEGAPVHTSVAADSPGTPTGRREIEEKVQTATDEVTALLEDPPVREAGSGLVEAATVAAEQLEPGDRILYLSDGLQWSPAAGRLMELDLSSAGISSLIHDLDQKGLLPDLTEVEVYFPLMLYHPESYKGRVVEANQIKAFWRAWADATGAELTIGGQTS